MRLKENLEIIENRNNVALRASLKCNCGCRSFSIFHSGKQTKGILSPHIKMKNKQLLIKTICSNCGNELIVFDSKFDGSHTTNIDHGELVEFIFNSNNIFEICIAHNYFKEDYLTDRFHDIFVLAKTKKGKEITLYE